MPIVPSTPHAVAVLRNERLSRSTKPFLARGGIKGERCAACRLVPSHCMCALRHQTASHAGFCLLMGDIEPLKPSNTGWLLADMVADTYAFGWSRTATDPALLALLADPQWVPIVVFPGEFATPQRLVHEVPVQSDLSQMAKRPLFILLDGTWAEARKMFRKSPYLDRLPVLSLNSMAASRYELRRSRCDAHLCTSEVAALCLALAGDAAKGAALKAYLDVYTHHYLQAKKQLLPDHNSPAHLHYKSLLGL